MAPPRMKLTQVLGNPDAAPFLYELLLERPQYAWISHATMPSRSEHENFVANHPFRYWYLLDANGTYVGALECTHANEIGVHILRRYQRYGHAKAGLKVFLRTHDPMPAVKAVRNGRWLVNIATGNLGAKTFFENAGFTPLQETWVL